MNVNEFYPIFLRSANVVIDSRKIGRGDLFFAFSGENYNAAERAAQAIEDGAVAVIVEDEYFLCTFNAGLFAGAGYFP